MYMHKDRDFMLHLYVICYIFTVQTVGNAVSVDGSVE